MRWNVYFTPGFDGNYYVNSKKDLGIDNIFLTQVLLENVELSYTEHSNPSITQIQVPYTETSLSYPSNLHYFNTLPGEICQLIYSLASSRVKA